MNFFRKRVGVPLWFLLFGAFSFVMLIINRLLVPSVRWYFRRRTNEVLHQVNDRLPVELPDFKLARRKELIGRVTYDPQVMEAVAEYSAEEGIPRDVVMEQVERYAHEVVPSFNAYMYFRFGAWVSRNLARSLYRVRVGSVDEAALEGIDPNASLVFVMNHRSNMDYVLLAHVAQDRVALSYAVGEWARVFPIQQLIKAMGGFFVRRGSGDKLYRKVLERYVQMATEGGVVQAMYPEGRLTRDGALQAPRLGLIDYMLRTFDPEGERDLVFIPMGVNYDRVLEDRTQLRSLDKSAQKLSKWEQVVGTVKFMRHNMRLRVQGGWYRFGYAVVNFGTPISTKAFAKERGAKFGAISKEERIDHAKALAQVLTDEVGKVVPVVPVAVVANVMLKHEKLSREEMGLNSAALINTLQQNGAHIYIPRDNEEYSIDVGIRMLTLRHIIVETDGIYHINEDEIDLLRYYANSITHLL